MQDGIIDIHLINMLWCLIPCALVLYIYFRWSLDASRAIYAFIRMLGQLLLIGYLLTYIFAANNAWMVLFVLFIMMTAASWIALGNVPGKATSLMKEAMIAIVLGAGISLVIAIWPVLQLDPWYKPQYVIPLAGMVFAASMNSVSLAVERYFSELERNKPITDARNIALNAAMIPVINSLFAVGLVSLPGMMTGQILSGVSPLIAARYQVMVMCIIFSASGLSAIIFLNLLCKKPINTDS